MFRTFRKPGSGFSLIEVLIIVVTVGVLVTLLVPRFIRSAARSKQTEAKKILKQIYTQEQAYHQKNNAYWDPQGAIAGRQTPEAFAELGIKIGSTARYSYSIENVTDKTFLATATIAAPGLDSDPAPDIWTIDNSGFLVTVSDDSVL